MELSCHEISPCKLVVATPTWRIILGLVLCLLPFFTAQGQGPGDGDRDRDLGPADLERALILQRAVIHSIAKAEASVVAIARVPKEQAAGVLGPGGIPAPSDPAFVPTEFGSGIVIDAGGLILTNHHVLADPEENDFHVWVQGTSYKAKRVLAADPWIDLAVLEIEANGLQAIEFGRGEDVRKGQFVIALGNPHAIARDGEPSASWGIIANTRRKAPRIGKPRVGLDNVHLTGTLLQTDARLALGSSGGALIDLNGQLVGMTTMLAASIGETATAGFAIPVDADFRRVVAQLRQGKSPEYGFLGLVPASLSVTDRRSGRMGVVIQSIIPNTPADLAGLLLDDVVWAIDGVTIGAPSDLSRIVGKKAANTVVELKISRRGREVIKQVKLGKRYLDSRRRAISVDKPSRWRGMLVDQPTAVPSLIGRAHAIDPDGCVGVADVVADSPAWQAGIRAGDFIRFVEGKRVSSPGRFALLVQAMEGTVEVTVSDGSREGKLYRIGPER
ncbi:MAG: trypsin-like peptidase domain-containing protein [Pirellulaceae bacterium]